jgi:hypothetical protein
MQHKPTCLGAQKLQQVSSGLEEAFGSFNCGHLPGMPTRSKLLMILEYGNEWELIPRALVCFAIALHLDGLLSSCIPDEAYYVYHLSVANELNTHRVAY